VFCTDYQSTGADPASKGRGAVSVIFGSQVSLRVHYCERDEVHFTTLLWQNNERQNGLKSRMLFSELHKIMAKKVTFIGFRGRGRPNRSPWIRPCQSTQWMLSTPARNYLPLKVNINMYVCSVSSEIC